jgi:threonine dehydratase
MRLCSYSAQSQERASQLLLAICCTQIMSLTPPQLSKGLVTCSTGNHALAFVWACSVHPQAQQAPSTIYLPTTASPAKLSRLLAQGANICQFSKDCALAEVEARRVADEQGLTYISPYNDWEVRTPTC